MRAKGPKAHTEVPSTRCHAHPDRTAYHYSLRTKLRYCQECWEGSRAEDLTK